MKPTDETMAMPGRQPQQMTPPPYNPNKVQQPAQPASTDMWKPVTIGGFAGVLLGAGGTLAIEQLLDSSDEEQLIADNEQPVEELMPAVEPTPTPQTADSNVVAASNTQPQPSADDLSFEEAFLVARAQVGPGGVFTWHGETYTTYTPDEWNALSPNQQAAFVQEVYAHYDVGARHIDVPAQPMINAAATESSVKEIIDHQDDAHLIGTHIDDEGVVWRGYDYHGTRSLGVDVNADGQNDVAIIDSDHSQSIAPNEVFNTQTAEPIFPDQTQWPDTPEADNTSFGVEASNTTPIVEDINMSVETDLGNDIDVTMDEPLMTFDV